MACVVLTAFTFVSGALRAVLCVLCSACCALRAACAVLLLCCGAVWCCWVVLHGSRWLWAHQIPFESIRARAVERGVLLARVPIRDFDHGDQVPPRSPASFLPNLLPAFSCPFPFLPTFQSSFCHIPLQIRSRSLQHSPSTHSPLSSPWPSRSPDLFTGPPTTTSRPHCVVLRRSCYRRRCGW
ncbi:unnamed protein product [Closterium sp. NIES-53]